MRLEQRRVERRRELDARLAVARIERGHDDEFGSRQRGGLGERRATAAAQRVPAAAAFPCPADPVRVRERKQQADGVAFRQVRRRGCT